jgi:hypothetical protein
MSRIEPRDRQRGGRGMVEARRQRRMHPTLTTLEDRRLLSTFTVSSTLDNGSVGTLRWAVGQATSAGGAQTIAFDKTVFKNPQTITLSGTQLELNDTTGTETITGPKAGVTVSGGGLSRVFQVDSGATASISGLTITGGKTVKGGGLYNDNGTAKLTDCTVSGNSTTGLGGGLYNHSGTVKLTNCTFSGNSASYGGGLYNINGTATLTDCSLSGNSAAVGGGRHDYFGTDKLTNCIVSGNTAAYSGGGEETYRRKATLSHCTVSDNFSGVYGGGVYNWGGKATLSYCTISGNSTGGSGGGVFNQKVDSPGYATLTNCTISGNSAGGSGGGMFNGSYTVNGRRLPCVATLTNCNVSGNSAADGGGIANQGTLTVSSCNILSNQATSEGGGIDTTFGSVTITDSFVTGNVASNSTGTASGGGDLR